MENGRNMPSWLHFDSSTREFWGRPEERDEGHYSLMIVRYPSETGSPDEGDIIGRLVIVVSCESPLSTRLVALLKIPIAT